MKTYDVGIIGSGPAGMSAAMELIKRDINLKMAIFEKGVRRSVEDRKDEHKRSCGWGGAGAFSDGKLNLTHLSGGLLDNLLTKGKLAILIDDVDKQYLKFWNQPSKERVPDERAKELKKEALVAGFKDFVFYPTRHWGTDNAYKITENIFNFLRESKVNIFCKRDVFGIAKKDKVFVLSTDSGDVFCRKLIFAGGRDSNEQMVGLAKKFNLNVESNGVDIGVRVETVAEAFEKFTNVVQSPKLVIDSDGNETRTFCVCPYGFVIPHYSYGVLTVNGESYSEKSSIRSDNTNFAILVHIDFTHPFNDPIAYGNEIAMLANRLGGGKVIVQTLYDLLRGKRSTVERVAKRSIAKPTLLDAQPANLGKALPYDVMKGVLKMLEYLMKIVPMNEHNVLLYGAEVKQYAQRVELDANFETEEGGLYIIGDGSGWSRGIMQASIMGLVAARHIVES